LHLKCNIASGGDCVMAKYIQRSLEPVLRKAVGQFPAVVLTGPRQSGKTTLLKHLFADKYGYVSLESPDIRAAAREDPRGFLEMYPSPVIFDEVQYAPDLLPYIKECLDADRGQVGQYLLTGSQNLLLAEKVTESLAGRVAMLRLLPLSRREAAGKPLSPLIWQDAGSRNGGAIHVSGKQLWQEFLRGGYPELEVNRERDISLWHGSYIQTYLERDVRSLRQIGDLSQFQNLLRALAARTAQLISLSDLARDLGVAVNTIKAWISVLEATYQVIVLRPWFVNIGKRLVKTPKIYFADVGTLCYLTGLKNPEHAAAGPMGGAIMETAVVSEIVRTLTHQGVEPRIYFWRTSSGSEVDIVIEVAGKLVPIEVKLSATPKPAFASSIKMFRKDYGDRVLPGYVVHPGDVRLPLVPGVTALPFAEL
jgi:predicted AAA+ superfamily ATPase